MPKRRKIDWERIEQEYRAGVPSVMEIARQRGISDGAIRNRARRKGWTRDLSNQVKQRAKAKLVRGSVTPSTRASEDEHTIEESSDLFASVAREHRESIGKVRAVADLLFDELRLNTMAKEELDDAIALLAEVDGGGNGKRKAAILKRARHAMNLPSRAATMRSLSASLKDLVAMERQSFGMDEIDRTPSDHIPLAERLRALQREREIEDAPNVERINGANGAGRAVKA